MKKIFKNFLVSHSAYSSYVVELSSNEYRPDTFNKFINHVHQDELITMAFVWADSVEGYDFWKGLAVLWAERLEELI